MWRPRWIFLIGVALAFPAALLSSAAITLAFHNFSDVPDAAFFHDAVEWLLNRSITAGCGGGQYCPDANVTRGQAAVFMRRLGIAVTPTILREHQAVGPVDLDSVPPRRVCTTTNYTPAFPQRAILHLATSGRGVGPATYSTLLAFSTSNWITFTGLKSQPISTTTGWWSTGVLMWDTEMNRNTPYSFAAIVSRVDGTADLDDFMCQIDVLVTNRNPSSSPF